MFLDALVAAFLLYFGLAGLLRGFWSSLFGLAGILTGYAAAYLYSGPLGAEIATRQGWPGPLCTALAGFALLMSGSLVWKIFAWWRQRRAKERGEDTVTGGERFAGLMFGLAQGSVLALAAIWGASLIPRDNPKLEPMRLNESVALRLFGPMTAPFTAYASQAITGDADTGRVLSQTLLNREEVEKKVSQLTHSTSFQDLASDPGLQQAFEAGTLDNLSQQPAFRRVMESPEAKDLIQSLGGGSGDTADLERGVEKLLARGTQMAHRMRHDEKLQNLTKDPQIKAMIEKKDFVSLMQHPQIAELFKSFSGK